MDLPLTIDLASQRFVYPGDLGIGVRQIELTKGCTYGVSLSFVSGYSGASFAPSGLSWNICHPGRATTPLVSFSGASGSSFPLFVASPVLDYAINGRTEAYLESYVAFSGGGVGYNLAPLGTLLLNNPSLTPLTEYYPLNANPSAYANSGDIGALQASIAALDMESGSFYPNSNPSGYVTSAALTGYQARSGILSFSFPLPVGANTAYVPFTPAFASVPTVAYVVDMPATGYMYAVATSGAVTPSGFRVLLSSTLSASGYSLSVIARA